MLFKNTCIVYNRLIKLYLATKNNSLGKKKFNNFRVNSVKDKIVHNMGRIFLPDQQNMYSKYSTQ